MKSKFLAISAICLGMVSGAMAQIAMQKIPTEVYSNPSGSTLPTSLKTTAPNLYGGVLVRTQTVADPSLYTASAPVSTSSFYKDVQLYDGAIKLTAGESTGSNTNGGFTLGVNSSGSELTLNSTNTAIFKADVGNNFILYSKLSAKSGLDITGDVKLTGAIKGQLSIISGGEWGYAQYIKVDNGHTKAISIEGPNSTHPFEIWGNGSVGIGGTPDDNYKLAVYGGITAQVVKVQDPVNGRFPDYVFNKDYDLKSLKDVEQYIAQHKHLPDVPSAADVSKNGIDLGEMNTVLLRKVEELTLYMLEQDKTANSQKELIAKQQAQIDALVEAVNKLKK